MTTSDNQGERRTSALDAAIIAENAFRPSRTFRSVIAFVAGMILASLNDVQMSRTYVLKSVVFLKGERNYVTFCFFG